MVDNKGSIVSACLWMFFISLILFWLPVFGSLIAGVIGGKKAGGVGKAVLAVFLPAIILGVILFMASSALSGLPIVGGVVAGLGGVTLALINVGPLLFAAVIGGLLRD